MVLNRANDRPSQLLGVAFAVGVVCCGFDLSYYIGVAGLARFARRKLERMRG